MDKIYIVIGILVCGLFGYASAIGWQMADAQSSQHSRPTGPGHYHK